MRDKVDHDSVDGAWDDVVRRISERLQPDSGGVSPARSELAEELVALERRAVEAEDLLARTRHAHDEKVRQMEGKLRRLEPWLRKLKDQFEDVCRERDGLAERLANITSACDDGARGERSALELELEAARAQRDAAIAEGEALLIQQQHDIDGRSEAWSQRVALAEAARDEAQERLLRMQGQLDDARRAGEELRQLRAELDQTHKTVAAHKAVARASQEETAKLRDRAEDLARQNKEQVALLRRKTREAERLESRLEEKRRKYQATRNERDEARAELDQARARVGELERAIARLDEEAAAADDACAEASDLRRTVEKLRQEAAEAKQSVARLTEESSHTHRTGGSAQDELVECRRKLDDARNDVERLEREVAAAVDRAEAAERTLEELKAEFEASRAQLGGALRGHESAASRASDLEEELARAVSARDEALQRAESAARDASEAEERFGRLTLELENARGAIAMLEAEKSGLDDAIAEEREAVRTRLEALESSASSQVVAAQSRQEAEIAKLRVRAEAAEIRLHELQAAADQVAAARLDDVRRIHLGVSAVLSDGFQRLVDGMEHVLGPDLGVATGGSTGAGAALSAGGRDWDRLIADLTELRTEVEQFCDVDVPTATSDDDAISPTVVDLSVEDEPTPAER